MTNDKYVSLGVLGRYYSVRHALGQYHSACVTATYHISPEDETGVPSEQFRFALELSLQATIRQHSGLRYGISEKTEAGIALFEQFDQIDRGDILTNFNSSDCISITDETTSDTLLSQVLGDAHDEDWLVNKPAWKVIVLDHFPGNSKVLGPSPRRVDIAFFAHHAIADGLSGIAFHASLAENFQKLSASLHQPTWPMKFSELGPPPVTLEERVDCLSCSCETCTSSTDNRKAWVGTTPQLSKTSFRSMVRIVTIPAESLLATLQKCKKERVTLTGFLHAVICTSLWYCVKEEVPGIRSITPFSARNHTKASGRDIVNHISYLTSYTSSKELEKLQVFEPGSAAEAQYIMELAKSFSGEIATKVGQFPHGSMATNLNRVRDSLLHYQSQGLADRRITYELSNLGLVSDAVPPDGGSINLEKVIFSQCATAVTPAICFNCVSTRDGPLVITITWAEGVIEGSLIDRVVRELQGRFGLDGDAD
ncbi:hypothetical protein F53441_14302 [Fusarium austroafricanum]|uniref:Alcohol acetyltransferase n=1 Tax=Fusarium austroafricanum TaxID=2364996 RepID=A0A8H4JFT0_9HYPO|nr:hypothetical protein F53441_14302 [Fusarium austroafricanum]